MTSASHRPSSSRSTSTLKVIKVSPTPNQYTTGAQFNSERDNSGGHDPAQEGSLSARADERDVDVLGQAFPGPSRLAAAHHADGSRLPAFVEQEFRDFLACGVLERGFARLRCGECAFERLVPFSCKGRGFCPSCGGRRMTECAARLVDDVLPRVPVRQWVLSVPHRLRYLLAWEHSLSRAVLGVYARVRLGFHRQRARRHGLRDGRSGCVTVIQRFGGGLNLNVHFHTLVLEGVFVEGADGALRFWALPPPTDDEVGMLLAAIAARVERLLRRRDFASGEGDVSGPDPIAEESPALAGISSAAIQGRIALGHRAGRRVWRVGSDPEAAWVVSGGPRHAHIAGCSQGPQR